MARARCTPPVRDGGKPQATYTTCGAVRSVSKETPRRVRYVDGARVELAEGVCRGWHPAERRCRTDGQHRRRVVGLAPRAGARGRRPRARTASSAAVPTSAPASSWATTASCRTTPSSTSPPCSRTASSSARRSSSPTTTTPARSTPTARLKRGDDWDAGRRHGRAPAPRSAPARCASRRSPSAAGPWSPPAPWSPRTCPTSRSSPVSRPGGYDWVGQAGRAPRTCRRRALACPSTGRVSRTSTTHLDEAAATSHSTEDHAPQ